MFTFVPYYNLTLLHKLYAMKERLLKIITSEGLTPSLLAEELSVQRSGISHILSGRNYPSFDFLQKLLVRFPKLNAEWLILGQGAMYKTTVADISNLFTDPTPVEKTPVLPIIPEQSQKLSPLEDDKKTQPKVEPEISPTEASKKTIEKMFVLYSDKTFVAYSPEA